MTYSSKKNLSRPCPSLDKRFFFSESYEILCQPETGKPFKGFFILFLSYLNFLGYPFFILLDFGVFFVYPFFILFFILVLSSLILVFFTKGKGLVYPFFILFLSLFYHFFILLAAKWIKIGFPRYERQRAEEKCRILSVFYPFLIFFLSFFYPPSCKMDQNWLPQVQKAKG